MPLERLKLSVIILMCLGLTSLHGQVTIPASGGNAAGSGGSISYTVGQVFYTTITGTTVSAAQGVQQPFEISVVTEIEEAASIRLSAVAYPNPTRDYLTLSVYDFNFSNLSYHIYDMQGKLLQSEKIADSKINIALHNRSAGTYFIKVFQNDKSVKTFKIIKH